MNDLTAYDFWGNATWTGGDDMARCERLRLYEETGMEPEEIKAMQRDNEAYRMAGLHYEEEIAKLKRELDVAMDDLRTALSAPPEEGCVLCKHLYDTCDDCKWEWRGVCAENTEVNKNEKV